MPHIYAIHKYTPTGGGGELCKKGAIFRKSPILVCFVLPYNAMQGHPMQHNIIMYGYIQTGMLGPQAWPGSLLVQPACLHVSIHDDIMLHWVALHCIIWQYQNTIELGIYRKYTLFCIIRPHLRWGCIYVLHKYEAIKTKKTLEILEKHQFQKKNVNFC